MACRIVTVIDQAASAPYHRATLAALAHAAAHLGVEVSIEVTPTDALDPADLGDGVVIGPGTPYRRPEAAHAAIRAARERGVPLVAT